MTKESLKNWLKYYRASLIDTVRGNKKSYLGEPISRDSFEINELYEEELKSILGKKNVYDTENPDIKINKIEIAPVFFQNDKEHSVAKGDSEIHYPYWIPAYLTNEGKLLPPEQEEIIPVFLREYLSPNPKDNPIIAEMERLDSEISNHTFKRGSWKEYWEDCETYFNKITDKKYADFQQGEIKFRICKYQYSFAIKAILDLYNHLVKQDEKSMNYNILEKVLAPETPEKIIDTKEIDNILIPNHYGHMSDEFPLSKSQREAFAKSQYEGHSDIFAINGPPGTGKTTILQSFIANHLVSAVLSETPPPLIVGCSTNNQAITNILESMKLENKNNDILQERWLPNVSSFGLYFASSSKKNNGELNDYQWAINPKFEEGFVNDLDKNLNIEEAEKYLIENFLEAIKALNPEYNFTEEVTLNDVLKELKTLISKNKRLIDRFIKVATDKYQLPSFLEKHNFSSEEVVLEAIDIQNDEIQKTTQLISSLENCKNALEVKYKSFPFYIKLFPFPSFKKIKENAFKFILKEHLELYPSDIKFSNYLQIQSSTEEIIINTENKLKELKNRHSDLTQIIDYCNSVNESYINGTSFWNENFSENWQNLLKKTGEEYQNLNIVEDMAVKLDISLRHRLFWLCVHYREAEFLIEQYNRESQNINERGENEYKSQLKRLAKITPIFIATFHTLPKFCSFSSKYKGNTFYNDIFDFMIVDEAGQVSPEVAIPSLVFTKKLLTVGDIHQIEPIWKISKPVDYKNAEMYKVIKDEANFNFLDKNGYLASSGSVMKLALTKSHFAYRTNYGELKDGVLLKEHRRCLDSIVSYSNRFVYQNSLILRGGKNHNKSHNLPNVGYLHINGICEKYQTSQRNIAEAKTIVQWLKNEKETLENAYNKPLSDIVAIITPYSAQKDEIQHLLNVNFPEEISKNMTVGTVHSLQGAERPIIIFSPTNSDPTKRLFMNYGGKHNMLNVAVTRAKHSFLVFGNMVVFKKGQNTPSSNLAEVLFSDENNALNGSFIYKTNTIFSDKEEFIKHITTLEGHRSELKNCFHSAQKEIIICSPFISANAIQDDNLSELIQKAIARKVKVTIITDKDFDIKNDNSLKEYSQKGRELLKEAGANLIVYDRIHNKTICVDDKILIEGSFNWLSAVRDENNQYSRKETSIMLQGPNVSEKVKAIKEIFIDKVNS